VSEFAAPLGGLRRADESIPVPGSAASPRELLVRHARKAGRSVAVVRVIDYGDSCVVEAEVFAPGAAAATRPGPYTFASGTQATAFVSEAVEALTYLGCEIAAQ
jgi:hypothetical protein